MSEAYNPETKDFEKLESLELKASNLAKKRDQAKGPERKILDQQLKEIENQIAVLKKRLKH